jgi:hypothetical protein
MELPDLARRMGNLAGDLAGTPGRLAQVDPGPAAFAGNGTGSLAALGQGLHRQLVAALAARGREATVHGARLAELGDRLLRAAEGYRLAEDAVQRQHRAPVDAGRGDSPVEAAGRGHWPAEDAGRRHWPDPSGTP